MAEAFQACRAASQSISAASNGGRGSQEAADACSPRRRAIRRRHSAVDEGRGGRVVARHILVMWKYGAHYKVNGPPVNVPTTLTQVIDMLPRMPQQLQIHPLKLKWKLEYKSHYMYDVIRKDHVMAPLSWLKEHNHHYRHVQFNSDWYNMILLYSWTWS